MRSGWVHLLLKHVCLCAWQRKVGEHLKQAEIVMIKSSCWCDGFIAD